MRIAQEIRTDQGFVADIEDTFHWSGRGCGKGVQQVFGVARGANFGDEIDYTDRGCGNAHGHAVKLAFKLWHNQRHSSGSAGCGRNNVHAGGPGASQILMNEVKDALVGRVGVHGGHQALLDADRVVYNLGRGGQAVGCAAGIADYVMAVRIVLFVVDTHADGDIFAFGRSAYDHLFCAGGEVEGSLFAIAKDAGALDDDINAHLTPGQLAWIALAEHFQPVSIDRQISIDLFNRAIEDAVVGIIFEQVGHGMHITQIVYGDEVESIVMVLEERLCYLTTDTPKAVNGDFGGHLRVSSAELTIAYDRNFTISR